MGILGLGLLGFAMAPDFALVLVMAFIIGACMVAARAAMAALLQAIVPDEKRGRVESAVNTIMTAATTLSMGLAGFLGDLLGLRMVFALAGTITLLAAGMAFYVLREPEIMPATAWEIEPKLVPPTEMKKHASISDPDSSSRQPVS
jgi:predicted MFS family arabinose efflux permease